MNDLFTSEETRTGYALRYACGSCGACHHVTTSASRAVDEIYTRMRGVPGWKEWHLHSFVPVFQGDGERFFAALKEGRVLTRSDFEVLIPTGGTRGVYGFSRAGPSDPAPACPANIAEAMIEAAKDYDYLFLSGEEAKMALSRYVNKRIEEERQKYPAFAS